jgi:hypothetical protein
MPDPRFVVAIVKIERQEVDPTDDWPRTNLSILLGPPIIEAAPTTQEAHPVPRIYSPGGNFQDIAGRFDYIYPELLRDPTLPAHMFPLPVEPYVYFVGSDRRDRQFLDEWDTEDC